MSNEQHTLDNTDVWMVHRDLVQAPKYALPAGYAMRFFQPGDVANWLRVQQAAEEYLTITAETFTTYMPDAELWPQRVMFLLDSTGNEIGSITAWHDAQMLGHTAGLVHWVAIVPEAQGKGLAKPMLSAALDLMQTLGYHEAWLGTGAARIPAINLYLHFGFQPLLRGTEDAEAWQRIAPRLSYPVQL